MPTFCAFLFFIFLVFTGSLNAVAQSDSVGIIKSVSGDVFITGSQTTVKAVTNMRIIQGDSIRTGANSGAGLIFNDDTVAALGPNSEMEIKNFLFDPVNKGLSFIAKMVHGTFSFITGQIAKLAPDNVTLQTPDATLGVRGTKFLVKID